MNQKQKADKKIINSVKSFLADIKKPARFWMCEVHPKQSVCGQMLVLNCLDRHEAEIEAQEIAKRTLSSWRLYDGPRHIITIFIGKSTSQPRLYPIEGEVERRARRFLSFS